MEIIVTIIRTLTYILLKKFEVKVVGMTLVDKII